MIRMFAFAAQEYGKEHPGRVDDADYAAIAVKNRRHGRLNPNAALCEVSCQFCFEKRHSVTKKAMMETETQDRWIRIKCGTVGLRE